MSVAGEMEAPLGPHSLCPGIRTSAMSVGRLGSAEAELLAAAVEFVMVNFGEVLPESPKTAGHGSVSTVKSRRCCAVRTDDDVVAALGHGGDRHLDSTGGDGEARGKSVGCTTLGCKKDVTAL